MSVSDSDIEYFLTVVDPPPDAKTRYIESIRKTAEDIIHTIGPVRIASVLLGSLFIRYGLEALLRYREMRQRRDAKTIQQLKLGLKNLPPLSSDMSIIVRTINDRGVPRAVFDAEDEFEVPERLQQAWEIVGQTVAASESDISPTFIPGSKGAVSFITISLPKEETQDIITDLESRLKQSHLIPSKTPKRGPLKSMKYLKLDSSVVNEKLHPELLISIIL
jgi:hypothetical protein